MPSTIAFVTRHSRSSNVCSTWLSSTRIRDRKLASVRMPGVGPTCGVGGGVEIGDGGRARREPVLPHVPCDGAEDRDEGGLGQHEEDRRGAKEGGGAHGRDGKDRQAEREPNLLSQRLAECGHAAVDRLATLGEAEADVSAAQV